MEKLDEIRISTNANANTNVDHQMHETWRSMAEGLYGDIKNLMANERALMSAELKEKMSEIKSASVSIVIGGVFLLVGFFALVATAIIFLDRTMDLGNASAVVTFVVLVVGIGLFFSGKKKLSGHHLVPRQSIDTLEHIGNTFKERINEYRSNTHH